MLLWLKKLCARVSKRVRVYNLGFHHIRVMEETVSTGGRRSTYCRRETAESTNIRLQKVRNEAQITQVCRVKVSVLG